MSNILSGFVSGEEASLQPLAIQNRSDVQIQMQNENYPSSSSAAVTSQIYQQSNNHLPQSFTFHGCTVSIVNNNNIIIIIIPHCAMGRIRPPQALSSAHDLAPPSGFHSRLGLWTSVLSLLTSSKLFWVYLAVFSPLGSRTILLLRRC